MTLHSGKHNEDGSTLITTVLTAAIIGIGLAGSLSLTSFQYRASWRSEVYNSVMPIAEAGIEEALTHLYYHATNLAVDNWTSVNGLNLSNGISLSGTQYFMPRSLGEGRYLVAISQSANPTIVSQGYVRKPRETNELARTVQVTTVPGSLFMKGLVAKGAISLSGGVRTDSFDSSDPNYSTNGRYDSAKFKDNGDIGSNARTPNAISANGGVTIYGHVATGPGGTVGTSGQVAMGSKAFIQGGGSGIQPGWFSANMNMAFPDVQVPFSGGGFTPGSGSVGGTNYTYVFGNGNWQMSGLSLSGQNKVIVNGNAVVYVTGNISLSGQSFIYIASGASLKLYCGGASASLTGQGVANANANATNFFYYGLPSNTSLSLSGNSAFTGVIYAPAAAFSMSGGGNNTYDLVGAGIVNTISMSGHYNFHYDENLGRVGGGGPYVVTSWNEL